MLNIGQLPHLVSCIMQNLAINMLCKSANTLPQEARSCYDSIE